MEALPRLRLQLLMNAFLTDSRLGVQYLKTLSDDGLATLWAELMDILPQLTGTLLEEQLARIKRLR